MLSSNYNDTFVFVYEIKFFDTGIPSDIYFILGL